MGVGVWSPHQRKGVSIKQFRFVVFIFTVISINSSRLDNRL